MIGAVIAATALAFGGATDVPARAAPRAVVWALGDGADGSAVAKRLARYIERDDPDAVLYLGDVYPSGTATDYERNVEPVYGALAPIIWPTGGNHDGATGRWATCPIGAAMDGPSRGIASTWAAGRWSASIRRSHMSRARASWAGSAGCWASGPPPAGSPSGTGPASAPAPCTATPPTSPPLWRALRGRARLVLNGHEHVMMRHRRRAGLTQYVAGTGGSIRYGLRPDRRVAFARSDRTGALRMVLTPSEARLEFRDVSGEVLDRSRATCRPALP